MPGVVQRVHHTITRNRLFGPSDRIVVGVSGGVDSLVLLHVLCELRKSFGWSLHAATLDHGIRGAAGAVDVAFVQETAAAWGVPVTVGRADVPTLANMAGLGLEETARQVRYTFLVRVVRHVSAFVVAVGHNRDDQAETVLMHVIRGSGLYGLRGMLPRMLLSDYHMLDDVPLVCDPPLGDLSMLSEMWPVLVRPLLDVPRAMIEEYAAEHNLTPRTDATNSDVTYFRNRLRHDVIPLLEELNPNMRDMLSRMADVLREDVVLLDRVVGQALERVVREQREDSIIIDRRAWTLLTISEKRYVLRSLVQRLRPQLRDVTYEHITRSITVVDGGITGAASTLPGGLVLRVDYDALVLTEHAAAVIAWDDDAPALDENAAVSTFLPADHVHRLVDRWRFEMRPPDPGDDIAVIHADPLAAALVVPAEAWLQLRTRRPGDRFAPRGMVGHSQKLGDTLINMKVPAMWRDRVPLLTVDGEIAWFVAPTPDGVRGRVSDRFVLDEQADQANTVIIIVRWRRDSAANK
ncbi:MAG: tRNA lysidine(34) synthetase TilS [Anaerolineae bacterium]|nr:tRNA lysidine(34) synthetase TilS [Anaerolineae bacterium]